MSDSEFDDRWAALTGLELLQSMITANESSPMGNLMDQRIVEAGDGLAVVAGLPSVRFYNNFQRIHGGFAATLLDTALGCAVMTKLGKGVGYGTIELKVNYVRRIDAETGPLACRATVLHAGRTMLTAEAKVADRAGLLYAHGTGTFLVYPK